jgi:PTS system mannose-specific IIA component
MAGILIIAHAPLATALRDCIAHVYGGLPARIGVIDVSPDCDPAEVVAFAYSEVERLKEENGALVLTDVNLPMLLRAVCYRATPLDTLVDKALSGATKGVQTIVPGSPPPPACAPVMGDCVPAMPPETDLTHKQGSTSL